MKRRGHQMSMNRKLEIVRTVLSKSKGVNILHGDRLISHVASSIILYELPTDKGD
jgi:hypothetical protein